ncbi:hypothetical protein LIER_03624 [Lithospermum erythrorhizon]|uniref:Uncharacterized protein n=1 Tax=Lithospermum erythrorhizon TaxID=34254 RepID=A0AAV3NWJ5_LITER
MSYGDIEPTMPGCEQGGLQGSQPYRTAYHFQPAKNWMNGKAFISLLCNAYMIFSYIVLADVMLVNPWMGNLNRSKWYFNFPHINL